MKPPLSSSCRCYYMGFVVQDPTRGFDFVKNPTLDYGILNEIVV